MQSYRDLKDQIQKLQTQAELARTQELASAIKEIQRLIAEFDLRPEDLFSRPKLRPRPVKRRGPAAIKYRDPESGAQWSGRGREPRWIAGRERDQFLIHDAHEIAERAA
ncbi:DNA-binding protein [Burkholderia sp. MSh2]|uniref:DNA-binding protein BprA n=1 Tax=Burkholderia paludis TaxID=1506587 RepID=A0A6P2N6W7_9BURK|nr:MULTISPECIES: H-NS histone family protein [Burkholderia]KEZ02696.1 DNA-binding protein [Burkholderia sp. MSh2]CAB3770182.1 DNA-binding protein Bv3F [Burkholderia paludis]VWB92575.1 DNA-binding protein BprA [Burkholderia paludis]